MNLKLYLKIIFGSLLILFCGPALGQPNINFPDPNLEAAVRRELGKPTGSLAADDLLSLTNLAARSLGITNLSGLEHAINLIDIYLDGNPIRDLRPLASLGRLSSLEASGGQISDLAPLAGLTNLINLALRSNPLTNCSALASLTNLFTLQLAKTSISNLDFLVRLTGLRNLGLEGNNLGEIPPVSGLTNLVTLYLDENPIRDGAQLSSCTNLWGLHLTYSQLTNVDCLKPLIGLIDLDLSNSRVTDLTPLSGLTNLAWLRLNFTPGVDFNVLAGLPNLVHFEAAYTCIGDLSFLRNWARLDMLQVGFNPVQDLSPLGNLTNLQTLAAGFAQITNITVLQTLPKLNWVAVQGNLLDLSPGSPAMDTVQKLQNRGGSVSYQPQNQPPHLEVVRDWTIPAMGTSYLGLVVWDDVSTCQLQVSAHSSNTNLVPDSALELIDTDCAWVLAVTLEKNQTGTTTITMTVTDNAGLSTNAEILVRATANVVFVDPYLDAFLRILLSKPKGPFTTLDLAQLTSLDAYGQNIQDVSGLEYADNLGSLSVAENSIGNATSLSKLAQLTELIASHNYISDITPLVALTNLEHLSLDSNPVIDVGALCGLPNLRRLEVENLFITNAGSLSCLTQLLGLDLSFNQISDPAPLLELVRLRDLNLTDNPLTNFNALAGFTNLTGLSLNGTSLTRPDCLASLTGLTYLDVSANPITNYSALSALTHLTGLTVSGCQLTDLGFIQDLTSLTNLTSLDVSFNKLTTAEPLAGLTNLSWLWLSFNQLTNITALESLPRLTTVDLRGNPLDLNPNSPAPNVIHRLQDQGVSVYYDGSPPRILLRPDWLITANQPASLEFEVADESTGLRPCTITANSSNQDLIPNSSLFITNTYYQSWHLIANPSPFQTGLAMITLTVTDETGLTTNASVRIRVIEPRAFDGRVLDASNLVWVTAGDAPWFAQTNVSHDGQSAAQSGDGSSSIQTTVTGPGIFTFWWNLSLPDPWVPADFVAFRSDSAVSALSRLDPGGDWHKQIVSLGEGRWVLKWEVTWQGWLYGDSSNTLWLDEVSFVPGPATCWLELIHTPMDRRVNLVAHGEPRKTYALEVSPDLHRWSRLQTLTLESFETYFTDANFDAPCRYYRLRSVAP